MPWGGWAVGMLTTHLLSRLPLLLPTSPDTHSSRQGPWGSSLPWTQSCPWLRSWTPQAALWVQTSP